MLDLAGILTTAYAALCLADRASRWYGLLGAVGYSWVLLWLFATCIYCVSLVFTAWGSFRARPIVRAPEEPSVWSPDDHDRDRT